MNLSPSSGAEANIILRYVDEETARAVSDSISPDNFQAPEGMKLCIKQEKTEMAIWIRCPKGIGSLISTIDDILSCIATAEKALNSVS